MDKQTKVEIQKINLKIDDIKIALTMEQAKKLHGCLAELFNKQIIYEHHYPYNKYWWPVLCSTGCNSSVSDMSLTTTTATATTYPITLTSCNTLDVNL